VAESSKPKVEHIIQSVVNKNNIVMKVEKARLSKLPEGRQEVVFVWTCTADAPGMFEGESPVS
jgi:hypothetical protein